MGKKLNTAQKVSVLTLIFEKRDILFGAFSATITKEIKDKCWEDVAAKAKSLGLINKTGSKLREETWQNWRRRTIGKRDNRRKTGTEGGQECILDDADKKLLEIIGSDSPVLDGLEVPESTGTDASAQNIEVSCEIVWHGDGEAQNGTNQYAVPVSSSSTPLASTGLNKRQTLFQAKVAEKRKISKDEENIREKKKALLDIEIYKRRLEAYDLETRLGLPHSTFTEEINNAGASDMKFSENGNGDF